MANALLLNRFCPGILTVFSPPSSRGPFESEGLYSIGRQRLPTDSLGICNVTLKNLVIGSRIRAEIYASGVEVTTTIASNATIILNIPYYTSGDSSNIIRLKVRNASSSPTYQPYETQVEVSSIPQTIFINQLLDE